MQSSQASAVTSRNPPSVGTAGYLLLSCYFFVCEYLAAVMILGADFYDRFERAISSVGKTIENEIGTTIPTLHRGSLYQQMAAQKN